MPTSRFALYTRRAAACAALGWLPALAGCGPNERPPQRQTTYDVNGQDVAWGTNWSEWDARKKADAVPGLDFAWVAYWTWNDRLALAVWFDRGHSPQGKGYWGSGGRYEFHVDYSWMSPKPDVRVPAVEVKCSTADGTTGTVTVGGEQYDLSNGPLFLVSTMGGTLRVKQLRRDLPASSLRGEPNAFEKLKTDPEVVGFFGPKKGP